jgi:hypothetical protein
MKDWLRCPVTPGQFSSEYAVVAEQFDGTEFSLFAPRTEVECDTEPRFEQPADGWLRVEVWSRQGDLLMIKLPQMAIGRGQFIKVRSGQMRQLATTG